ncbi:hypothetical protein HDU83_004902 [Entophlyctis luteolus]|nr:hypothetical protein HDU83_004902 [Entophlyctis luteolus]
MPAMKVSTRSSTVGLCIVCFIAAICGSIAAIIKNETQAALNKMADAVETSSNVENFGTAGYEGVLVELTVISVDPVALIAKAQCDFLLSPTYSAPRSANVTFDYTVQAMTITVGSDIFKFPALSALVTTQGTLLLSGDVGLYPFDAYATAALAISATAGNASRAVPVYVAVYHSANGYAARAVLTETAADATAAGDAATEIFALVTLERAIAVRALALMIAAGMWVMTLCCCALAVFLAYAQRPVEVPHIALSATILFAMPGVRNSMPNAPAIGAVIDETVLIWAMLLVAICLCSHFIRFIMKAHRDYVALQASE